MFFKSFKIILVASLMGVVGNSAWGQDLTTAQLKEGLAAVQQTLPIMVDEETRWDRVEGAAGEAIYYYTLVNYTYDQLDWKTVEAIVQKSATTNYCTNLQMTAFRDGGVGLLYIYSDKNGEITGTVKISKTSCGD